MAVGRLEFRLLEHQAVGPLFDGQVDESLGPLNSFNDTDLGAQERAQTLCGFQSGPDENVVRSGGDGNVVGFIQFRDSFGYGV